jgi:lysophospholipase
VVGCGDSPDQETSTDTQSQDQETSTDTETNNQDGRTCPSGTFLVTKEGCGDDGLGELTEFCVDQKWQHHSCNHPGDWPEHDYSSGYLEGCSGQIHFQRWKQKTSAAANLVIINGRTDYVDKYHHMISAIAKQWDIVSFDHFGQGRSDGPRAHADDFDAQHVCDLDKILEVATNSQLPTFVMAHSMGGFVAIRYEQLHPGVIDGLVLNAPMLGLDSSPMTTEQAINLAGMAVQEGRGEVNYKENYVRTDCEDWKQTHDCTLFEQFRNDPLTVIGYPTYGWLYAALTGMQTAFDEIEKVKTPILLFQAELDTTVLLEPQNEFCDALDQCELAVRQGEYHDLWCELNRQEIFDQAIAFFDEILAAR